MNRQTVLSTGPPWSVWQYTEGQKSCCRKLPVQLWEEVKTTRTDLVMIIIIAEQKRAWLTHFSLEPMLSECACVHVWVQAGGGLQQVCQRKVLAPMQQRWGGNAERYSSSSSLHHQPWSDWTLPDRSACVVSLCLREHIWRVTEPPPQTRKPQIHSSSAPCLWMFFSVLSLLTVSRKK